MFFPSQQTFGPSYTKLTIFYIWSKSKNLDNLTNKYTLVN